VRVLIRFARAHPLTLLHARAVRSSLCARAQVSVEAAAALLKKLMSAACPPAEAARLRANAGPHPRSPGDWVPLRPSRLPGTPAAAFETRVGAFARSARVQQPGALAAAMAQRRDEEARGCGDADADDGGYYGGEEEEAEEEEAEEAEAAVAVQEASVDADAACEVCGRTDGADTMLICDGGCNGGFHTACVRLRAIPAGDWACDTCAAAAAAAANASPPPSSARAKQLAEEAIDPATACEVCARSDGEETMLLCDGCNCGFHTQCVRLKAVPFGDWQCARCLGADALPALRGGSSKKKRAAAAAAAAVAAAAEEEESPARAGQRTPPATLRAAGVAPRAAAATAPAPAPAAPATATGTNARRGGAAPRPKSAPRAACSALRSAKTERRGGGGGGDTPATAPQVPLRPRRKSIFPDVDDVMVTPRSDAPRDAQDDISAFDTPRGAKRARGAAERAGAAAAAAEAAQATPPSPSDGSPGDAHHAAPPAGGLMAMLGRAVMFRSWQKYGREM
jgi:hypothetical protein